DISTYGLTIGITQQHSNAFHFTSIVIQCNPPISSRAKLRSTYNVSYAKNFDPNTRTYKTYALHVDQLALPGLLMELSKAYFKQLNQSTEETDKSLNDKRTKITPLKERQVYPCSDCL